MNKKLRDNASEIKEISFDSNIENLKLDYLDIFKGIKSEVIYTVQYDRNSDIETSQLGMPKMRRQDELKAEEKSPIK